MEQYSRGGYDKLSMCNRTSEIFDSNAVQPRGYYGYGDGNNTPAFHPTFDSLSILASLAFLAFLLQCFVSLFDRSRSIIPTISSGRKKSLPFEPTDPMQFIVRALDEYEILNKVALLSNEEQRRRKPPKNRL